MLSNVFSDSGSENKSDVVKTEEVKSTTETPSTTGGIFETIFPNDGVLHNLYKNNKSTVDTFLGKYSPSIKSEEVKPTLECGFYETFRGKLKESFEKNSVDGLKYEDVETVIGKFYDRFVEKKSVDELKEDLENSSSNDFVSSLLKLVLVEIPSESTETALSGTKILDDTVTKPSFTEDPVVNAQVTEPEEAFKNSTEMATKLLEMLVPGKFKYANDKKNNFFEPMENSDTEEVKPNIADIAYNTFRDQLKDSFNNRTDKSFGKLKYEDLETVVAPLFGAINTQVSSDFDSTIPNPGIPKNLMQNLFSGMATIMSICETSPESSCETVCKLPLKTVDESLLEDENVTFGEPLDEINMDELLND